MMILAIVVSLVLIILGWFLGSIIHMVTASKKGLQHNWRAYSPYHFFTDGPNGYFEWLKKRDPDWWR